MFLMTGIIYISLLQGITMKKKLLVTLSLWAVGTLHSMDNLTKTDKQTGADITVDTTVDLTADLRAQTFRNDQEAIEYFTVHIKELKAGKERLLKRLETETGRNKESTRKLIL